MDGRGKAFTYTSRQALRYPYRYPDLIPNHCRFHDYFLSTPLLHLSRVVLLCVGYIFCDEGTVEIKNPTSSKCQAILCFSDASKPYYCKHCCDQKVMAQTFLPCGSCPFCLATWREEVAQWTWELPTVFSSWNVLVLPSSPIIVNGASRCSDDWQSCVPCHCISEGMQLFQTKWRSLSWRGVLGASSTHIAGFSCYRFVVLTEAGGKLHPQDSQKLVVSKMQHFLSDFVAVLESHYMWIYFSLSLGLSLASFLPSFLPGWIYPVFWLQLLFFFFFFITSCLCGLRFCIFNITELSILQQLRAKIISHRLMGWLRWMYL